MWSCSSLPALLPMRSCRNQTRSVLPQSENWLLFDILSAAVCRVALCLQFLNVKCVFSFTFNQLWLHTSIFQIKIPPPFLHMEFFSILLSSSLYLQQSASHLSSSAPPPPPFSSSSLLHNGCGCNASQRDEAASETEREADGEKRSPARTHVDA